MDHNGGPEPAREGPQGLPGAGGPMGFLPGFPQLQLGGLVPVLPPPRTFPAPIGVPVGGDVGRAPPVKCPFELSLRDPDFYHRLMTECSKEEKMVSQQRGGEYHAPKFITDYLKRNDVRPLKKVQGRKALKSGSGNNGSGNNVGLVHGGHDFFVLFFSLCLSFSSFLFLFSFRGLKSFLTRSITAASATTTATP